MVVIYVIEHTSGHIYLGYTGQDPSERWTQHRSQLRRGKHPNAYIQHVWNRYGESEFSFWVLDEFQTLFEAQAAERFYIQWFVDLKLSYNLKPGGSGGKPTPETRAKISAALKGRPNLYLKGRPFSEAHRTKLSAARKGKAPPNKGKLATAETRAKISAVQKGRPSPLRGRSLSVEHIKKLRAAHLGQQPQVTPEQREKGVAARRGQKRTGEACERMSQAQKKRLEDPKHRAALEAIQQSGAAARKGQRDSAAICEKRNESVRATWRRKKGDGDRGKGVDGGLFDVP